MELKSITNAISATEASGVVRSGDSLLIVTDADPGAYYKVPLRGVSAKLILMPAGTAERCELIGQNLAVDLEAIDVLSDGRIVALSERLRSLIGPQGIVVQYDDPLSEFGERGLEGLSVRKDDADGSSWVAVLWEGGYAGREDLPRELERQIGGLPLRPVVLVHKLGKDQQMLKAKITDPGDLVELQVPAPSDVLEIPFAQRFRAPDLIWNRYDDVDGAPQWGFIVLLNSQNSPPLYSGLNPEFGPRWLQRFDRTGKPMGEPIDLDRAAQQIIVNNKLEGANWEGLAWYEHGKSVVVVHDEPNLIAEDIPAALVIDLPLFWPEMGRARL